MLHLSLLRLPRDHPRWRTLDAYQAHQLAWTAFPGVPRGEGVRPFLFHLDTRTDAHSLLVQSMQAPDWTGLQADGDVRTKTAPAEVPEGMVLAFALRANPTVARRAGDGTSRRMPVGLAPGVAFERMGRSGQHPTEPAAVAGWRDAELRAWLERQAERGGFAVEAASVGPVLRRRVVRGRDAAQMTFHEAEFTGRLRVVDTARFAAARAEGVGRGRAFGFGLLMVRPA